MLSSTPLPSSDLPPAALFAFAAMVVLPSIAVVIARRSAAAAPAPPGSEAW
jgi:hypothetical protein